MSLIEELFKINKKSIKDLNTGIQDIKSTKQVSSFTNSFVSSTLAEAQAFSPVTTEYKHITNARKSGETAGNGTGLPAFYDISSGVWCDFTGSPIQV